LLDKIFDATANNLKAAQMDIDLNKYLLNSVKYSLLATVFFWFIYALFFKEIIIGFAFAIGFFAAAICFFLYLPVLKKKKLSAEIEKDLPLALMAISAELNTNIGFEKALKNICKEDYGLVSREFQKVWVEVSAKGASLQEAFISLGERYDSSILKRALSQLANVYEQGTGRMCGESVKRVAMEQLARQQAEAKEFSGKLVVFSLMFIAVSAIIPAMFQAFMIVGSMFMEIGFSAIEVLLISAIVFPLIDISILFYIKNKTPLFMRD